MEHASTILTWQENLSREEMPPEWMWGVHHELDVWFERLDDERQNRSGGGDNDQSGGPMMTNEYADDMRRNRG